MGSKVCDLADTFDQAIILEKAMGRSFGQALPIKMIGNSKPLFEIVTTESTTSEKRLAIDLKAVKASHRNTDSSDIVLVRSESKPADAFT